MTSMRTKAGIATAAALSVIAIGALAPAGDAASGVCGSDSGSGGTGATGSGSSCDSGKYVNPFKHQSWYAGRIDMGVDYMPNHRYPVRAIGKAKILGSDSHSGWPGGHFLWYKLLRGDHKGDIIYVAETLKKLVPAGTKVGPRRDDRQGAAERYRNRDGLGQQARRDACRALLQRGHEDPLRQGDGPFPERARGRRRQQGEERARLPHRPALLDGP